MDCNSKSYQDACDRVHAIVASVTKDISLERIKNVRLVRKRMSVFTFGLCSAVADQTSIDRAELYYCYLLKGGLKSHQAEVVVKRTSTEFIDQDYAKGCYQSAYDIATNKLPLEKINPQKISGLLISNQDDYV